MNNITESTLQVAKLTAKEGFYLTQSVIEDEKNRTFTKVAFLAYSQTSDYWREAKQGEKEEWESWNESQGNIEL